jgi:hypothetical protein
MQHRVRRSQVTKHRGQCKGTARQRRGALVQVGGTAGCTPCGTIRLQTAKLLTFIEALVDAYTLRMRQKVLLNLQSNASDRSGMRLPLMQLQLMVSACHGQNLPCCSRHRCGLRGQEWAVLQGGQRRVQCPRLPAHVPRLQHCSARGSPSGVLICIVNDIRRYQQRQVC